MLLKIQLEKLYKENVENRFEEHFESCICRVGFRDEHFYRLLLEDFQIKSISSETAESEELKHKYSKVLQKLNKLAGRSPLTITNEAIIFNLSFDLRSNDMLLIECFDLDTFKSKSQKAFASYSMLLESLIIDKSFCIIDDFLIEPNTASTLEVN